MNRGLLAGIGGAVAAALLCAAFLLPRLGHHGETIRIGGPFTLLDGSGKQVTDADFHGRWMLVYFGYTHCPDACPTTLSDLAIALDRLPEASRAKTVPVFITVDPGRDTPAVIGDYAHAFGPTFTGLTGTEAQLTDVERKYRVFAQKHPLKNGDYAMDHSSVIYVVDPRGSFAGLLDDGMTPQQMAERLVKIGV